MNRLVGMVNSDATITEWMGPNVCQSDGVRLALDGRAYNTPVDQIIPLYRQHGFRGMLERMNGDFALALFDSSTKTLYLARDRFGIKPLFYQHKGSRLVFGARLRSLLGLPGISNAPNPTFVAIFAGSHYRYFDNQPEATPYKDLSQLPAAHYLEFKGGTLKKVRYWELSEQPDWTEPENDLAERYRDLLLDAVSIRLKGNPSSAFTLSGGMDSSSVLASAVQMTGQKQPAFSAVYDDKTYDESDEIRPMAKDYVSTWNPVRIGNPDTFALIQRMIDIHDEPVATATWLSHERVCQAASEKGFTGLFNGLGGDELNAGEYEYFFYFFADLQQQGRQAELEDEIKQWAHYHDHPIYRKNRNVALDTLSRIADLSVPGRCLPDRKRLERYRHAVNPDFFNLSSYEPVMDHPFQSYLKNRTYQDIFRETAPCCLRALDRHTAAYNLESLTPFFDHRLVEFMFRIPGTMKIRGGVTKHLLRSAMKGVLPEETRTRVKKVGWNAPSHVWFSGERRGPLLDLVHSRSFRERGIYNVPEVLRLIDEHEAIVSSGRAAENHMMFLWQLVNLEIWLSNLKAVPPSPEVLKKA